MWLLDEESEELADVLSDFLGQGGHAEAARANLEAGDVPLSTVWSGLVDALGLAGLVLPEETGGGGGSLRDAVVAQFVWGRSGASAPLLSHLLSAEALLRVPAGQHHEVLVEELVGGIVVTVVPKPLTGVEATELPGGDLVLSGVVESVLDAPLAHRAILLLPDASEGGVTVVAVDLSQPEVYITPRVSWCGTRAYGDIRLEQARVSIVGRGSAQYADGVLSVARLLLAAERLGGAFACLDRSVEHARTRVQFDRPIGSFQGVKHPLADEFVQLQMAQAQLRRALEETMEGRESAAESALLTAVVCDRAFRRAAEQDIEVHGGMGYTWENDSHLFFRRSRSDAELAGGTSGDLLSLLTTLQEGR